MNSAHRHSNSASEEQCTNMSFNIKTNEVPFKQKSLHSLFLVVPEDVSFVSQSGRSWGTRRHLAGRHLQTYFHTRVAHALQMAEPHDVRNSARVSQTHTESGADPKGFRAMKPGNVRCTTTTTFLLHKKQLLHCSNAASIQVCQSLGVDAA